jgi:hypothetical protein
LRFLKTDNVKAKSLRWSVAAARAFSSSDQVRWVSAADKLGYAFRRPFRRLEIGQHTPGPRIYFYGFEGMPGASARDGGQSLPRVLVAPCIVEVAADEIFDLHRDSL